MWWKPNQSRFPALARMVEDIYLYQSHQLRAFSIARAIVNKKSACLLPENILSRTCIELYLTILVLFLWFYKSLYLHVLHMHYRVSTVISLLG